LGIPDECQMANVGKGIGAAADGYGREGHAYGLCQGALRDTWRDGATARDRTEAPRCDPARMDPKPHLDS
jgi:hypothetical protein